MPAPAVVMPEIYDHRPTRDNSAGVVSGVLGIVFGLLGIFTIGLIFVPLAGLCSCVGLIRGNAAGNRLGVGLSLIGGFLTAAGFSVSPSLWLLAGAGALVDAASSGSSGTQASQSTATLQPSTSTANVSPRLPGAKAVDPARVSSLTEKIGHLNSQLPLIKSSSDNLQRRFTASAGRIAEFETANRGLPFSVTRSQAALKVNNGYLQDGAAYLQIVRAKSDWSFKIDPLLSEIGELNTACLVISGREVEPGEISPECAQLREASIEFRIAAQSAKSSIAAAEAAYKSEVKVGETILRP